MLLDPGARAITLIPLGLFFPTVGIPALFLLAFWFVQQFVLGSLSLGQAAAGAPGQLQTRRLAPVNRTAGGRAQAAWRLTTTSVASSSQARPAPKA